MCKFSVGDRIKSIKKADAPVLVIDKITYICDWEVYVVSPLSGSISKKDSVITTYGTDRDYEIFQDAGW